MPEQGGDEPLKVQHRNTAEQIRDLEAEHRDLEGRLRVLTRRAYLTPTEQREASLLKKRKLSAKDALHALGGRR